MGTEELEMGEPLEKPKMHDEFRRLPKKGDRLAEELYDQERKRKRISNLLKARLYTTTRIIAPFKPSRKYTPDIESSGMASIPRGKIGLARVNIKKMEFVSPTRLKAKDILSSTEVEAPKFLIRYKSRIFTTGAYFGLRGTTALGARGFYVKYVESNRLGDGIAIVPTLIRHALRNPKDIFRRYDFAYKLLSGKRRLLLIIVFDCSESMEPYTPILLRTLMMLHKTAWKIRSPVGLIGIIREKPRVVVYPTTNINKLIRGILNLEFGGKTPLASALLAAYRLIVSTSIKYRDVIPQILLITDGIANIELDRPLDNYYRNLMTSPAQADVLSAGRILATKKIRMVIVNPWHIDKWPGKYILSPTRLLQLLAKTTGGTYLGFDLRSMFDPHKSTSIKEKAIWAITREIVYTIFSSLTKE